MYRPEPSSLPADFERVIRLAQERHGIKVVILEELKGGRTGAQLFLVSVTAKDAAQIEHFVLKLDRIPKKARIDEIQRHRLALSLAPSEFASQHMAELAFEVELEGVMAIFYAIAGQSLQHFRPLAFHERQDQLETIVSATNDLLLNGWNAGRTFDQALHPREVLDRWLGYRLEPRGNVEEFLAEVCQVDHRTSGFLIEGRVFPNPLLYGRHADPWGPVRPIDVATGFQHGDLNIGNILVKFAGNRQQLEGYFLIDFALFKADMPLLYDQRYLEMSYLIRELGRTTYPKWVDLVTRFAREDTVDLRQAPVELAGACAVINAGRRAFERWVRASHPSLSDDLWGQFWLAAVAAGLNYCNKKAIPEEERLAGLIFAAAHLKRYCTQFSARMPVEVSLVYDASQKDLPTKIRAAPVSPGMPSHNLPAQPTPFIGRAEEVACVRDTLLREDVRLLTLTGPGGTGKTRLGLQVAGELLDYFRLGVVFVPLADISDPGLVLSKVAQQLGVREGGSQSLMALVKGYLRDKRFFLLLDNFEQVVSAAPVVADLLAEAPELKVMVTSRTLLNLRGEHEYSVPPLRLPDGEELATAGEVAKYEAIQLFVDRAEAANPRFRISDESALIVGEICQRLDGLPLAIELAAARVKLLTPQAILARLSGRLALLTGGARDLPARQQTLRNTIDWSYELLEEGEQILFARLGVFVGGFTLGAAEATCNLEGKLDVLEGVEALMNNSLLRQEETSDGQVRFRMLETIREYALERLQERGEWERLRRQHAAYYGREMSEITFGNKLFSSEGRFWLNWLDREYENLRATLAWSQSVPDGAWHAIASIGALFWYWYRRGYFSEGRQYCEWALSTPDAQGENQVRGYGLLLRGIMAMWQGDLAEAQSSIEEGLVVWQRLEEDLGVSTGLLFTGFVLLNRGEDAAANSVLKQALTMFEEANSPWQQADTLVHLANAAIGMGNLDQASIYLRQAETISRDVGDGWLIALVLNNYGEVARVQGDYRQAAAYYEESERLLREEGDKGGDLARLVHSLGYVAQRQGDQIKAERQFHDSLALFRKLGNKRGIAECLAGLAGLWAEGGKPEAAARLLGAAKALLSTSEQSWWPADRVEYEINLQTIQASLSEETFNRAWAVGQAMTLETAVDAALQGPEESAA